MERGIISCLLIECLNNGISGLKIFLFAIYNKMEHKILVDILSLPVNITTERIWSHCTWEVAAGKAGGSSVHFEHSETHTS